MDNGIGLEKKLDIKAPTHRKHYVPVNVKFYLSHTAAAIWVIFSILISFDWLGDLAAVFTLPVSIFVICGIAYIPGYLNAFLVMSLIFDRQPPFKHQDIWKEIVIMIAAKNEAKGIANTLKYLKDQDYEGRIKVMLIDNGSTDSTINEAKKAAESLGLDLTILCEPDPGKFNALNLGLKHVATEYVITLDADTLLHKSAVRHLVSRIESAPDEVCAVAGAVLVRNSRDNIITKIQEWDYFLGIASVKRLQGLYQGTLVAQGAYSIYRTKNISEVGGWPDAIGEDIVLTWNMLRKGWKVFFEPMAVAFTDVPSSIKAFSRQRSRWARGMIEALKLTKPWQQPMIYVKYLTGINLIMPYLDISYTFFWLPGLVLAFFGIFWIVGPLTLLVLPLTIISYSFLYAFQKNVFRELDLKVRRNFIGLILFVIVYQMLMSPVSVYGYLQEFFMLRRIWK